jgi:hypothetical protein
MISPVFFFAGSHEAPENAFVTLPIQIVVNESLR